MYIFHNPFWKNLAEYIFNRKLELSLKPFSYVGSFNYRVMPATLVELAFLSIGKDEEELSDDNFRKKEGAKIYQGILDYLE